jgi:cytoskeletal protein RodZ
MGNEQLHDPLLQAARNYLKDHEEPFDGSDWDRMEKSLDQLPKSRTFKWSYSLNTILVVVGVAALSWGAYAMLGSSSNAPTPAAVNKPQTEKETPVVIAKTTAPQVQPVKQDVSQEPFTATTVAEPAANTAASNTATTDRPKRKKNPETVTAGANNETTPAVTAPAIGETPSFSDLVFGDQLDKRMGPVKETQEDLGRIGDVPSVDPNELIYYDFLNGKATPIRLKDTSKKVLPPKSDDSRESQF